MDDTATPPPAAKPLMSFDFRSIVGSPFFWLVIGAGVVLLLQHKAKSKSLGSMPAPRRVEPIDV